VYVPLALGQQIIVLNEQQSGLNGSSKLDLPQLAQSLVQYQPHSLILTPQLLQALLLICQQQPALAANFRFIAVGGAHCAPALLAQAAQLGLPIYQGYGLSEAGSVVALNLPGANRPAVCRLFRRNTTRRRQLAGYRRFGTTGQRWLSEH
jgi:acyl-CoA synthetase (AMP-forming)/AMP-acid ligase II